MKQKYLLIGAVVILFILITLISLIGNVAKKTSVSPSFQQPTPFNAKMNINDQKNYVAFQNLLGILSGSAGQNSVTTPSSTTKTSTSTPLTDEEIAKKNELKARQNYESFNNLLGIMFGQGTTQGTSSQQQSSFFPSDKSTVSPSPTPSRSLVYYPQCKGPYDNDPLPGGCNICAAGCGPTSVAMILSSYIDKKYTPPAVVALYKENGLTAGCQGTTIVDAQTILSQNGMKTTDILYYGGSSTEEAIQDIKNYLNNGWTMFTLVKFNPKWGHFYWVTDVDENNNVWAYDPADGRRPVPLNENSLEPSPKYYLAIGVKK